MKKILSVLAVLLLFTAGSVGASMTSASADIASVMNGPNISFSVATLLASWDMSGQPGNQEFTPGISTEFVTAENMVRGDGLSPSGASNSFSSTGWAGTDAGDYMQFGFTVASGYTVTINELWLGTRSSGTGPGTIGVYTSLDGYSSPVFTITQNNTAYSNSIIDLSALGPISDTFYVRLIEIGNTQADGSGETADTGTFRVADYYDDGVYFDVLLTGDVSTVPLPAAAWLLGSGLVGLLGVRRRC